MCTAIGALRGQDVDESYLSAFGFKAPGAELTSLHAVFDYLQSVDLTWTLACLEQESQLTPTPPGLPLAHIFHPEQRPPPEDGEPPEAAAPLTEGEEEEDEEEELQEE
jgi:hypothetical protein